MMVTKMSRVPTGPDQEEFFLKEEIENLSDSFPLLDEIPDDQLFVDGRENQIILDNDDLFKFDFDESKEKLMPSTATSFPMIPITSSEQPTIPVEPASYTTDKNEVRSENDMTASNESARTESPKAKTSKKSTAMKAIEAAKKRAQQIATTSADQRRDRKRAAEGPTQGSDSKKAKADEEESSDDGKNDPEVLKQKRHERRLQKNRDTAYISRIRRRVYTKELEASLVEAESAKADKEKENEDLRDQVERLKAEVASLKGNASSGSRSQSSVPSESEPDEPEKQVEDPASSSLFFTDFFQDIISPISPRVDVGGTNMRVTLFMFVLLFGIFLPNADLSRIGGGVTPRSYMPSAALTFPSRSIGSDKLREGGGSVWDPSSFLKSEAELLDSRYTNTEAEDIAGPSRPTRTAPPSTVVTDKLAPPEPKSRDDGECDINEEVEERNSNTNETQVAGTKTKVEPVTTDPVKEEPVICSS